MNLADLLKHQSKMNPNGLAYRFLVNDQEERVLSYTQLHRLSEELAEKLAVGIQPGERALLLYPPGLEFIIAFFACVAAKIIPVPLPLPKVSDSISKLHHVIEDCSPLAILSTAAHVKAISHQIPSIYLMQVIATDIAEIDIEPVARRVTGTTNVALIQYTSGSTSQPKGVVLSHENIISNLGHIKFAFSHTEESIGVVWLPHFHDMGLIGGILEPLFANFPVTLMSPISFMQRPMRWIKAIEKYRATTSGGPNFAYEMCVAKANTLVEPNFDLSCWKVAFNGAEPIKSATLRRFVDAFGKHRFRASAFLTCYGLAEATLLVTSGRPGPHFSDESISSGKSQPETKVQIMRINCDLPSPVGDIGEITIIGPSVSVGYWGQPALNKTSIGCRTGDLGYFRGNELYITGRLKDLIVVRGKNIYPEDIESSIRDSHPELLNEGAAAIGIEGSDGEELVYLQEMRTRVLKKINVTQLANGIKNIILERHGISPKEVLFLPAGHLSRTSSGKISRSATKVLYVARKFHSDQLANHRI